MSAYFTVSGEPENVTVIEKSRFICSLKNVNGEEEAREFIEKTRKKYSLANHHCYAYIADGEGRSFRFSDDGEPQGTAGLPILNALKSKNLSCTAAVVTRFFGGVKLGAGGLTRAYFNSVTECVAKSALKNMRSARFYRVRCDYDGYAKILKIVENGGFAVEETDFTDKVSLLIAAETDNGADFKFESAVADAFKGKKVFEKESHGFYDFAEGVCRK